MVQEESSKSISEWLFGIGFAYIALNMIFFGLTAAPTVLIIGICYAINSIILIPPLNENIIEKRLKIKLSRKNKILLVIGLFLLPWLIFLIFGV